MSNLLKSREFWLLAITLVVTIIVALVPALAASKDIIITSSMALVGVILVTIGAEKTAAASASGMTKIERVDAANADATIALAPSPEVKAPVIP